MAVEQPAPVVDRWSDPGRPWQLSEIDIFRDLDASEVEAIGMSAQMREVAMGTVLLSPDQAQEVLFILKKGRVRQYRIAADGRTLTTAIVEPGQLFGDMVALGQRAEDSYAEALDRSVVCIMSRSDVDRLLLSDPRVAARIAEKLGARVAELESRLADTVLMTVPARIASALAALAGESGHADVRLTHEQLADLVGTTRETTTKVLGDLRDRGLVQLKRGRIVVRDGSALRRTAQAEALTPVTGGQRGAS